MNTAGIFKKRGKSKVEIDYTLFDVFQSYKEDILKNYTTKYKIDRRLHNKIAKEVNEEIVKLMIRENFEFIVPCNLGILSIKKSKVTPRIDKKTGKLNKKTLPVDWKATRELWVTNPEMKDKKKIIYNMNEHTNGWRYSFYWAKKAMKVGGKQIYMFKAVRANSRMISSEIKANPKLDFYTKFITEC